MMTPRFAIEVQGAGLALVAPEGVVAAEPACALFDDDVVLTGSRARGRARLAPLFTSTRHLEEPNTLPLPRQKPAVRSNADLVYAEFSALARGPAAAAGPVLLAVSGAYSLEELRLLLGIAAAAGLAVSGLVDAALAATALQGSLPRALHLDLDMHRAVLTELIRGDGARRGRVDVARGTGLRAVEDALAQHLARAFVRATRFDPLHQAVSEQALYDRLPGWLAAAADGAAVATLEHGGLRHEARLDVGQLAAALAPLAGEVLKLVHSARRAGEPLTLFVGARAAAVPGLLSELATLRDATLVALPPGAAGQGALAAAAEIAAPEPALVSRLAAAVPVAAAPSPASRPPAERVPTHIVWQGRAWALGPEPLLVGRTASGPRAITLSEALAGVSRAHCTLVALGGEAVLEDLSTYGTFVNGERVVRRVHLAAGDRVRVGTPGIELELVRLTG